MSERRVSRALRGERIFEPIGLAEPLRETSLEPITESDPDLLRALRIHGLSLA